MKVYELIQDLAHLPADAEVLLRDEEGDPVACYVQARSATMVAYKSVRIKRRYCADENGQKGQVAAVILMAP